MGARVTRSQAASESLPLLTPTSITALLARHHLRPTKAFGQHYLADPHTARRIVELAQLEPATRVLEIGPGLGSLTLALLEAGMDIDAVEVDGRVAAVLRDVLGDACGGETPRVRIRVTDAVRADLHALAPNCAHLVANLPYNIATPLLLRLLQDAPWLETATVMVQREVGQRLAAAPGASAYGAVSAKVAALAQADVVAAVSRRAFVPPPRVESVIVRLVRRVHPDLASAPYPAFAAVVEAAFAQRRKTLRNALGARWKTPGEVASACFRAGIDPGLRGERLGVGEFAALARELGPPAP